MSHSFDFRMEFSQIAEPFSRSRAGIATRMA
jgi:hypothetical protein